MFVLPVGVRRRLTYTLPHLSRSSVICLWSFAFRCWRRTSLLALFQVREVRISSYIVCGLFLSLFVVWMDKSLFWCVEFFAWFVGLEKHICCRRIRARTVNLAQASWARLSESDEGEPRPSARVIAQAGGSDFWARVYLAQARWARLSELVCFCLCYRTLA